MEPSAHEILPEERIASPVSILLTDSRLAGLSFTEIVAFLSPYVQLEILEAQHQERIMCLSDFYNLRERLMERERSSFQKKSELFLQIAQRPEAARIGIGIKKL